MPSPHRPFVLVNMAMSADGKTATANRAVNTLGTPADLQNLYRLRASTDAILCGARTANQPGVQLDSGGDEFLRLRRRHGLAPHPLRIVVSGQARLNPDADVFHPARAPLIVLVSETAPRSAVAALRQRASDVRAFGQDQVDLGAALAWLASHHGVRRLVCEGGAKLNDAMFRGGWVDELHLTLCPKVLGGREAPTICDGLGVPRLADAVQLELQQARHRGEELFLVYRVRSPIAGTRSPESPAPPSIPLLPPD